MSKIEAETLRTVHPIGSRPVHPIPQVNCTVGLDSFAITDTRSRHSDTDFVTVSVAVGSQTPQSQTRSLGDLNNGNYPLNMHFHVSLLPTDIVVLTYAMVNNGHTAPGTVEQSLEKGIQGLASTGAQIAAKEASTAIGTALGASIGTAALPVIGTALGALSGFLVGGVFGLIFADCDGPVAAGVHALTGAQIQAAIAGGHGLTHIDDHPGVDSSDGCGSNSHYTVTWSVH